jgi:hypothetical protein
MDEVNVAVMAPILGRDLSFVSDVDPRVRVFDANFAAPGRRPGSRTWPGRTSLGLPESVLRQLAGKAGFTQVRPVEMDNPFNRLYELAR